MVNLYILVMFTALNNYQILPIKGNPFDTIETCRETLEDIKKLNPTQFYGQYYTELKCLTKAKNYLEIQH